MYPGKTPDIKGGLLGLRKDPVVPHEMPNWHIRSGCESNQHGGSTKEAGMHGGRGGSKLGNSIVTLIEPC